MPVVPPDQIEYADVLAKSTMPPSIT